MSTWIVTADHDEFDLVNLDQSKVKAFSMAWSLSQINRFNGHCLRPYSVAEHSLLVCEIAERELGLDIFGQLSALMHDGHEAYCGDMHTPGKRSLGNAWAIFERSLEELVWRAFGIKGQSQIFASAIKQADLMALATERRDLVPFTATPWPDLRGIEPIPWVRLDSPERTKMTWEDWRDRWLDKYHELDFARNEKLFGCSRHDAPTPSDQPQG
ncbi:MAG: hypothetical protein HEQ39_09540 [Rhizobacter sp.]